MEESQEQKAARTRRMNIFYASESKFREWDVERALKERIDGVIARFHEEYARR